MEELVSGSDHLSMVSLGDVGLLVDDIDAHVKQEPTSTATINVPCTSRTGDNMLMCAL